MDQRTAAELEAAIDRIRAAPRDAGAIELIVRRPSAGEREVLEEAELALDAGVVGDRWGAGSRNPENQMTVMSARAIAAIAERDRWALAGDQLFVDLDLAEANLPVGARLAVGSAVIEVTAKPHHGCGKFTARFGSDAARWVNAPVGRELRLRGIHARVVVAGRVRRGDQIAKVT